MSKRLDGFIKKLQSLGNYCILRDKGSIVVGAKITIVRSCEMETTFSSYQRTEEQELPVFFLLSFDKESCELKETFEECDLPVLRIGEIKETITAEEIRNALNKFVEKEFDL